MYGNLGYSNEGEMYGGGEMGYQSPGMYPYPNYNHNFMGGVDFAKTEPTGSSTDASLFRNHATSSARPMLEGTPEYSNCINTGTAGNGISMAGLASTSGEITIGAVKEEKAYDNFRQEIILKLKDIIFNGRLTGPEAEQVKNIFQNVCY